MSDPNEQKPGAVSTLNLGPLKSLGVIVVAVVIFDQFHRRRDAQAERHAALRLKQRRLNDEEYREGEARIARLEELKRHRSRYPEHLR